MRIKKQPKLQNQKIPVIDVGAFIGGDLSQLEELASQVRQAQEKVGYYYLVGHGVNSDLIKRTFEVIAQFFNLPENEKNSLKINEHQIGYIPPKSSLLKTSGIENNTKLDTNEAFQLMRDRFPHDKKVTNGVRFNGLNQWPSDELLPNFRSVMAEYHENMSQLGWCMLPIYSVALELEKNHLYQYFRDPHFINRNAHYTPSYGENNQFGLAAHSDHGFITFLPLSSEPGLEVKTQSGDWMAVPHLHNAMFINTGEFLSRWTNGRFIATPHRVVIPKAHRYAITFFYNPSDETINKVFPSCVNNKGKLLYEPTTFLQYLKEYAEGNYLHQAEFAKRQNAASYKEASRLPDK
ncbi:MAG: 2-oxoglutarate and iron-dependent oxygenase domain-containing protein [Alphaproteobacteria bacterium]|nr:2-oxoglutarate and iron-dependent oxygenase domain-containing protein [Alphaproteobacteria bacterium]